MKKILLFASALAGLFLAASCQQENLEPEQMASTVKFTVEAPGAIATKTIADGLNVNEVHYEVYKNVEDVDHALLDPTSEPMAKGVVAMENKKANITLDLLQDQEYTVIFWAQVEGAGHYDTSDLRCIELAQNHQVDANDETRAAFFKRFDFDTYEHRDYANIILRRPFAQLNLLTTMESLKPVSTGQTSGYEIDAKESEIIVTGLAASFNTVTGVGNGVDYPFTFNMAATPEEQGQATLTVNGKNYHYVSMNYMFVPVDAEDGSATVELKYEIVTDKGSIKHEIVNVPIRENYRTNVIGNLFTKESKFEIIVDAEFDGQNHVDVWDGREVSEPAIVDGKYVISTAAELAWLSAAVNGTLPVVVTKATETPKAQTFKGETFVLLEDIDLANPSIEIPTTWTPIGATGKFQGTFDGNGKTIRGLKVVAEGKASAGLFANCQGLVKNLTVEGAVITGHYKTGVIVGDGLCSRIENCHVVGATVTVTPYNQNEANNVGGIVGYLSAEPTAYVKGCSVKDSKITAYRKVGGIVGAANGKSEVTGNTVSETKVKADQTSAYNEVKAADAGAVVGYAHPNAVVEPNTLGEGVEVVVILDSSDELSLAGNGYVFLEDGEYGLTSDLNVKGALQIENGAEVVLDAEGNSIVSGSAADYGFIVRGEGSSLVLNDANIDSKGGAIAADEGAEVTVNGGSVAVNSTSTSGRYNVYAVGEGTEVTINGGEFSFSKSLNQKRAYIYCGAGATVYVKGGTFGKASTRSGYTAGILGEGKVIISGGTFGFDPTKWVAYGYTAKKEGQNWVVVSTAANMSELVATPGATVKVAAGEYAFPKTIAEGVNIVCEPGTVFTGSANLNIKTASVEGATFKNENGSVVNSGSISGTYKNCVFEGKNVFRYGYAGESLVFEDCTFIETADEWVFHFDGASTGVTNASIICRRCTFDGDRVAIGGGVKSLVMEDCDFINGYYFNSYCNSEYTGCDFNTSVRPLAAHHKYTDCTIKGSALSVSNLTLFKGYDCTLNIDGVAYTYADGFVTNAEGAVVVWRRDVLENALNAATADMDIFVLNDIYGDVTVAQKAGVKIVINGNGKNYDGMITVDGKSATYTTAGLTVKNLTFNASSIAGDACIRLGDGTNATRYTCNVAVENCTFAVPGAVGVKSYTGGDKNLKLSGCTATAAAHSLLQVAGVDEVLVEGCTINSKNGMNFNNSVKVTINECEADVKGYAARFGAGSADTAVETYAITNSTLKSACEDGDAVIILRGSAANSTLTLTNTTLVGTTEITNNTNAQVIR